MLVRVSVVCLCSRPITYDEAKRTVVNMVPMVKMFGWERKMASRVGEKREDELKWIKKRQFMDLVNDMLM